MKILYWVTVLLIFSAVVDSGMATTIVIIRNDSAVYIGADSRLADEHGQSLGRECKIIKIGDYYFAHAGLGMDPLYGFNIQKIAFDIFSSNNLFAHKLDTFISHVDSECTAYLDRIENKRPDIYARIVNGRINIETVVAGREEGIAFFKVIKFSAATAEHGAQIYTPVRYSCPGDCEGGKVVAMMGQMENSEKIVDDWAYSMMRNPAKAINFLINREIKNNKKVGPPITILKIGRKETTWLQHDELCPDE